MRCILALLLVVASSFSSFAGDAKPAQDIFSQENLAAWCIVPFDAKKRGPEERAEMLARLGFTKFAYDWRDEHIPTFDRELEELQKRHIELIAWWFPGTLNESAHKILDALKRHKIHTQLWVSISDPKGATPDEKISNAANTIRPIAEAAAAQGCKVGLYNHGGWFGEPENQIAVVENLKMPNVGLVYNFHHGHGHVPRFPTLFKAMQPYLLAVNINGMSKDGEKSAKKIIPVGSGDNELDMLKVVRESGWRGPVGILCHRAELDAEVALRDNLKGLKKLCAENFSAPQP